MPQSNTSKFSWLLLSLLLLVYSNSFTASWHFDDIPRIVINPNIHLTSLNLESLSKTFYSLEESPEKLYRPVASLTFGLNWFIGQDNVFGYHLFNLTLHWLTGILLFRCLLLFYQTPALRHTAKKHILPISSLTALIWSLHPIQTQAVTYIVQRMAVLAALFMVLGIFIYLKYRLTTEFSQTHKKHYVFLPLLALCYVLAAGSKENAILFPANILLIELIFFFNPKSWRYHAKTILTLGILIIAGVFIILATTEHWRQIPLLSGYENRFFTIQERLLTEPRIIILYLLQLFYPIPQQLSLAHDVQLSSSLTSPLTTLSAIFLIGGLLFISVKKIIRWPIFSFAILFFFLNHLVESTIIPLELVFEHRNYLPSLFLFWPLAVLFVATFPSLFTTKGLSSFFLQPAIFVLILLLGISTYTRNQTWQTDASLWQDAHMKAPGRARPIYYLAVNAKEAGNSEQALQNYRTAISLTAPSPVRFRSLVYRDIADLQVKLGDYDGASKSYQHILKLQPDSALPLYKLAEISFLTGNLQLAENYLRKLIAQRKAAEKTYALLGKTLLLQGRAKEAVGELAASLQKKQNQDTALDFAIALTALGRYREAGQITNRFFFPAQSHNLPLELLESVIQAATGLPLNEVQADTLLARYPLPSIQKTLTRFMDSGISPDYIHDVRLFFSSRIKKKISHLFTAVSNA